MSIESASFILVWSISYTLYQVRKQLMEWRLYERISTCGSVCLMNNLTEKSVCSPPAECTFWRGKFVINIDFCE